MNKLRPELPLLGLLLWGCGASAGGFDGSSPISDAATQAASDGGGDADTGADGAAGPDASAGPDAPAQLPQMAIYDDTAEDDGSAWAEGLDLIEAAVGSAGPAPVRITRAELNGDPDALAGIDVILFGGGFAYPGYTLGITAAGKQRLRDFVAAGGVYAGTCAGAYFACDQLLYEGEVIGDESGYDLDLYDGPCYGPVAEIAQYPSWALAQIELPGHPSHQETGPSVTNAVWYAGGPYFPQPGGDVTVLATYADSGIAQEGQAAVIASSYGAGMVLLWGPHFEVTGDGASAGNPALYAEIVRWFGMN